MIFYEEIIKKDFNHLCKKNEHKIRQFYFELEKEIVPVVEKAFDCQLIEDIKNFLPPSLTYALNVKM